MNTKTVFPGNVVFEKDLTVYGNLVVNGLLTTVNPVNRVVYRETLISDYPFWDRLRILFNLKPKKK